MIDIVPEPEISIDRQMVMEANIAFANQLPVSIGSLIKLFEPKIEGNEISISMNKTHINLTDPVKVEWQKFLKQYFGSEKIQLTLIEDHSVMEQTKAYTQKEQLEELMKENPLISDLVRKLNLKLK